MICSFILQSFIIDELDIYTKFPSVNNNTIELSVFICCFIFGIILYSIINLLYLVRILIYSCLAILMYDFWFYRLE